MGKKKRLNRIITKWIKSDLPDVDGGIADGNVTTVLLLSVTRIPTSPTPERRQLVLHPPQCQQVVAQQQQRDCRSSSRTSPPSSTFYHPSNNHLYQHQRCNGNGQHLGPGPRPTIPTQSPWKLGYRRLDDVATSSDDAMPTSPRQYCRSSVPSALIRDTVVTAAEKSAPSGRNSPTNAMDRSVDSIGNCSLDVDALSMGNLSVAADLPEKISVDTLRSVSFLTSPSAHQVHTTTSTHAQISIPCPDVVSRGRTSAVGNNVRLPSYLSLACTVNGYSTTTNYDPERLLSRSRDPSPHRLSDKVSGTQPTYSTLNNLLSPPNLVPLPSTRTMNNNVTTIYTSTKTTIPYLSKDTSNSFVKNMFENDNRTNAVESNGIMRSSHIYERESAEGCINSNGFHHNKQLIEEYSASKSFIQQRVERLYGPGALAQGFFVTKRRQNRSYNDCDNSNTLDTSANESHSKSFSIGVVQKSVHDETDKSRQMKQSTSSPALPVMRHLRPEFRAQLPAFCPRKTVASNAVVVLHSGSNELAQIQKSNTLPVIKDSFIGGATNPGVNGHDRDVHENSAISTNLNGVERSNETGFDACPSNTDNNGTIVKDGRYFLQVLPRETDRLLVLAQQAEELLDSEADLSEEITGLIRSTSGKARLLVTQKMQQFKGLCTNNITQNVEETFPTTNEDLQGFWDMVLLQINQVDQLFQNLDKLKANNWEEEQEQLVVTKPVSSNGSRKVINRRVCASSTNNSAAEEARKQRDIQRKRMIEERRKAIRQRKEQCAGQQDNVEIFVPDNS